MPRNNQVNVGLIGTGRLGRSYADFLAHRVPGARLVAVADLIPERARTCAEANDVPKWYDGHRELIADPAVEALVITATTTNHFEIVIDAAPSRKPIFCEKPLTLSISDARAMKAAIERSGVFFQMGFMRRFDSAFSALKSKIDQGVIGTPVLFRGSSRDPYRPSLEYLAPENSGGQIIDMAIHDIDIARWCMGEFRTVYAIGGVLAYPEMGPVGDTDNAILSFTLESGALGEIDISRNGIYGYDIRAEVQGTKGSIQAGYLRETPILVMTEAGVMHDVVPYFPQRFREAYVAQLDDFIRNVQSQSPSRITIEDGIAALQVAVAGTHSLKENRIVAVKDF